MELKSSNISNDQPLNKTSLANNDQITKPSIRKSILDNKEVSKKTINALEYSLLFNSSNLSSLLLEHQAYLKRIESVINHLECILTKENDNKEEYDNNSFTTNINTTSFGDSQKNSSTCSNTTSYNDRQSPYLSSKLPSSATSNNITCTIPSSINTSSSNTRLSSFDHSNLTSIDSELSSVSENMHSVPQSNPSPSLLDVPHDSIDLKKHLNSATEDIISLINLQFQSEKDLLREREEHYMLVKSLRSAMAMMALQIQEYTPYKNESLDASTQTTPTEKEKLMPSLRSLVRRGTPQKTGASNTTNTSGTSPQTANQYRSSAKKTIQAQSAHLLQNEADIQDDKEKERPFIDGLLEIFEKEIKRFIVF